MQGYSKTVPIPLRTRFSASELSKEKPADDVKALGSYWSRSDDIDLQSRLVRFFKEPYHSPLNHPCMTAITRAYAGMMAVIAAEFKPSAVVRVLSSGETRPDPAKPHSLLARLVCESAGANDYTHLFFRTEPRKPLRMIDRLAGPEVLRQRISYVLQDLFVTPANIGEDVLLIDDIYNLGATARVYSAALKTICGANRVYSLNIAAARFLSGKDGWGFLSLDLEQFLKYARASLTSTDPPDSFDEVWISKGETEYHFRQNCSRIIGKPHKSLVFLARPDKVPCPSCSLESAGSVISNWIKRGLGK